MLDTNKMIDELLKSIGDKLHNNPELFLIDPTSSANSDFRYSKEGLVNRKAVSIGLLQLLIAQPDEINNIYDMLEDDTSKKTFEWFMKYKIAYSFIGDFAKYLFPFPNTRKYLALREKERKIVKNEDSSYTIDGYKIYSIDEAIYDTWLFEIYKTDKIAPRKGDVILSGGAFYGETTVWFASQIGEKGHIYAFEPLVYAKEYIDKNVEQNNLQNIVSSFNYALWNETKTIFIKDKQLSSECVEANGIMPVQGITIDDFMRNKGITKLDFIKLDIEGAEINALQGAVESICKYRPRLAISIYHRVDDIIKIPKFIRSLCC